MPTRIALLPARGGSKRIPRKNIRAFAGMPALCRVISLIEASGVVGRILVSTDDDEIAKVGNGCGAEVMSRPPQLSDDKTGLLAVVRHVIEDHLIDQSDITGDMTVICVLPTALLMSPADLRSAVERSERAEGQMVVAVGRFDYPIQRALRGIGDNNVEMIWPEHQATRTQDLEESFHDAGQFYVASANVWMQRASVLSPGVLAQNVESWRVKDIDVEEDWRHAELLWKAFGST